MTSGTYAINGTDLTLQPTSGRWIPRDELGIDGAGHPMYPAVRDFELKWGLMSTSEFEQIQNFYLSVSNTGTVSVYVPKYGVSPYVFEIYSGCTLKEPSIGDGYFADDGYIPDVVLVIMNIQT